MLPTYASHCAFPGPLFLPFTFSPRNTRQARPRARLHHWDLPSDAHPRTRLAHHPSTSPPPFTLPLTPTKDQSPVPPTNLPNRASRTLSRRRVTLPIPPLRPRPSRSSHAGSRGCSSTGLFLSTRNQSIASARIASCLVGHLPTQHRTTGQNPHWDLEAHPQGPRRKTGPNSCAYVPAPTPCAAVTSPPTLLSTNEPAANSNHPPW